MNRRSETYLARREAEARARAAAALGALGRTVQEARTLPADAVRAAPARGLGLGFAGGFLGAWASAGPRRGCGRVTRIVRLARLGSALL